MGGPSRSASIAPPAATLGSCRSPMSLPAAIPTEQDATSIRNSLRAAPSSSTSTALTIRTAPTTPAGCARSHRRRIISRSPSRPGRNGSAMGTESEIRIVPDAALPDDEPWRGDVQWNADVAPPPPAAPLAPAAPEEAARLRKSAVDAARRHVERVVRREARLATHLRPDWGDRELTTARCCVIDLETTGTGPDDEIVEVGCVHVDGNEIDAEHSRLV